MTVPTYFPSLRIPNLPTGPIVDQNGMPTAEELMFRQALLTLLQNLVGDVGTVITNQTQANITTIMDNTQTTPVPSGDLTTYTTQFGTMFYNSDAPSMSNPGGYGLQVAVNDGSGIPVIKTITLS